MSNYIIEIQSRAYHQKLRNPNNGREESRVILSEDDYNFLIEYISGLEGEVHTHEQDVVRFHNRSVKFKDEALHYRKALEEIVEAKENNYGWEYPEIVDEIATAALKGEVR